ncbi:MAG: hypothetical protein K0Q68_450 [Moraxellaceae bacterium]|jgi:uncharacterized membrane protein (DUF4010 family)|nr:hypothetical protein [Moraxellaceae bacterium]
MTELPPDVIALGAALGIGLLVGIERERKKLRSADAHEPAGLRTFAITAVLGWASLALGGVPLLAAVAVGLSALLAIAYYRASTQDPGLTTEVALLLVLLLGAFCHRSPAMAVAVGVVLALLLAYREGLHHFVRAQLTETEVRDGLVLASAALVILPLVPDAYIGPYEAINLRTVWMLCVLMMSIGALGHLAIRLAGPRFGLPLAGFISGFASSTATVASMGERSRREPATLKPAVAAATLSSATTMLLMAVVLAAIDIRILPALALPLLGAFLTACAYAAHFSLSDHVRAEPDPLNRHIFDWRMAVGAALVIALVQLFSALFFHWMGNPGVLLSTAMSGFADVHAAAASGAVLVAAGKVAPDAVVLPVLAAITTNTVSKCVMAAITGGWAYASRVIAGLALIIAALWLPWLVG